MKNKLFKIFMLSISITILLIAILITGFVIGNVQEMSSAKVIFGLFISLMFYVTGYCGLRYYNDIKELEEENK